MSLLSIAKTMLDSNGWKVFSASVASSSDDNMRQVFALANKELTSLGFRKAWPVLVKEQEIITVAGQAEYDLPVDFHHVVNPSVFNASKYYALKGNLQPMEFIRYSSQMLGPNNPCTGYRIQQKAKKLRIVPTPDADGERLVYFYVSRNLVKDSAGNEKPLFSQDDDVALLDEDLIELGLNWRWRQKKGLDFTAELAEYSGIVDQRYAQYLALPEFNIGGRPYDQPPITDGTVQGPFGP